MAKIMDKESAHIIVGPARNRALAHVVNVLGYDNFLCKCVRAQVDFQCGNFLSVDPVDRHFDRIENFAWGSGAGHDNAIARRLFNTLTSSPNRFMVVDDVMGDVSSSSKSSATIDISVKHDNL